MSAATTSVTTLTPAVYVRESTKYGKELVFGRNLHRGDVAFTELPFVSDIGPSDNKDTRTFYNNRSAWHLVERLLQLKTPQERQPLFDYEANFVNSCAMKFQDADQAVVDRLMKTFHVSIEYVMTLFDVLCTNILVTSHKDISFEGSFLIRLPVTHGFFMSLSRINHHCSPSAELVTNEDESKGVFIRALRDVCAGESITIDYSERENLLSNPRKKILQTYGFRCTCSTCETLCEVVECVKKGTKLCECKKARYCSKDHQKIDWNNHKRRFHSPKTQ